MLELNTEIVQQIIDHAYEYQTLSSGNFDDAGDDDVTLPDDLDEPLAHEPDEPIYLELKTAIDDLEPDQQISLVALMWLGRGEFTLDEWDSALQRASESWNTRTADYLIRTPLLGDYLSEGLELLRDLSDIE